MFEILLLIGLVLVIGFAGRWIFEKTKIPEVIILLFFGFALGPLGLISYFVQNIDLQYLRGIAPMIGVVAIISLVFEAGLRLRIKGLPKNLAFSGFTALLSIITSILALSGILHFALGWGVADSLVLSSILGGMSSFAAYSILPLIRTTNNTRSELYLEATISTIATSILAIAFMRFSEFAGQNSLALFSGAVFHLFSVSFILGIALGIFLLLIITHFSIKRFGSFLLFAVLLIIYYVDFVLLGGIGIISIAMVGFVLVNADDFFRLVKKNALPFEVDEPFREIQREISVFINTFFFVYLGLIFRPSQLNLQNVLLSVLLVAGILVVRIILTILTSKFGKFHEHENFLRSIMVPRDLLSATLATFIVIYPASATFGIEPVYLVIALSTLVMWVGISQYERIFRGTFLFHQEVTLSSGRKVVVT